MLNLDITDCINPFLLFGILKQKWCMLEVKYCKFFSGGTMVTSLPKTTANPQNSRPARFVRSFSAGVMATVNADPYGLPEGATTTILGS